MKSTYLSKKHRPKQHGAQLDENHISVNKMNFNDYLFVENSESNVNCICIGPKEDRVLQLVDVNTDDKDKVLMFFIEEIFETWSYICRDGKIVFVYHSAKYGNLICKPKTIYFRSTYCDEKSKYWEALHNLLQLLNQWPDKILCRPDLHHLNNSKLAQKLLSLIPGIRETGANVSVPKCYVIKGEMFLKGLADKKLITKSLSSYHSDVVDNKVFNSWDVKSLNNIPALFQEIVDGCDIRIHKLNDDYAGMKIPKTVKENYRYDTRSSNVENFMISDELKSFCAKISEIEDNNLMGIDFIEHPNGGLVCLEANPGPGWSAYHHKEKRDGKSFLSKFINELTNA